MEIKVENKRGEQKQPAQPLIIQPKRIGFAQIPMVAVEKNGQH